MALSTRARRACMHVGTTLAVLTVALLIPLLPSVAGADVAISLGLSPNRAVTSVVALLTAASVAFAVPFAVAWLGSALSPTPRGR